MKTTTKWDETMSVLDKINLAACAARRCKENCLNNNRFNGDLDAVMLWKNHKVYHNVSFNGQLYHFTMR